MPAETNRQLVETFYNVMWNNWSRETARTILTADIAANNERSIPTACSYRE